MVSTMSGNLTIKQLEHMAITIRKDIIRMLEKAGSGHSAGPLGLADVLTALYFSIMNIDPENPEWDERDFFFFRPRPKPARVGSCVTSSLA